jgi:hypothetical protein
VYGAWANDHEQPFPSILSLDDLDGFMARSHHGLPRVFGLRDLMLKKVRRHKRIIAFNTPVLCVLPVASGLVLRKELI